MLSQDCKIEPLFGGPHRYTTKVYPIMAVTKLNDRDANPDKPLTLDQLLAEIEGNIEYQG